MGYSLLFYGRDLRKTPNASYLARVLLRSAATKSMLVALRAVFLLSYDLTLSYQCYCMECCILAESEKIYDQVLNEVLNDATCRGERSCLSSPQGSKQ